MACLWISYPVKVARYVMSAGRSEYPKTQTALILRLQDTVEGVSWGEFMVVYNKLIFSIARKSGLPHEDAMDVAQEAIIKAHKNIKGYEPQRGTFRNWLGVITKSCIVDHFRKQGRRPPAGWQRALEEGEESGKDRADNRDAFGEMWDAEARNYLVEMALERLKTKVKPRDFQVFHCAKFLEWSMEKICGSLEITVNNAYQINNRVGGKFEGIVRTLEQELPNSIQD